MIKKNNIVKNSLNKSKFSKKIYIKNWDENGEIMPNVRFNIFLIVSMLFLILVLFSAIIYFQNVRINELSNKLSENNKIEFYQFESIRYKMEEFSKISGLEKMQSLVDLNNYMNINGYQIIDLSYGFIEGKKKGNCKYDEKWKVNLCEVEILQFNQKKGIFVQFTTGKVEESQIDKLI